jgi:DNA repair exonuclease SbcCD ATPase subunit
VHSKNSQLLEQSIKQLENLQTELSQEREKQIQDLELIISQEIGKQQETKGAYSKIKEDLDKAKIQLKELKDKKSNAAFSISDIDKKLAIYQKNKCPHCLSDLTDTLHTEIKQSLIDSRSQFTEKLEPIAKKIGEIESAVTDLEGSQETIRNSYAKITNQLDSAKKQLTQLTSSIDSEKQTQYLQKIINDLTQDISKNEGELSELESSLAINQELEDILSDNGMKKLLMNQIIPLLNKNILRTSKLLEFKFAFEFDLEFNPIITHLGIQISPESLSAGEQKKMNLIVLLCILELIKMKNNNINILFLDEIFSSLDSVSIYKVVDLLQTFAKKHAMTVFVISHDPLPEEFFDTKVFVENKDHFSDIRIN